VQYLHIKQLEKYHPKYKDRTLQWAKIHFKMVQGDPDCELIENEIDWARLIKFILLELQAQRPIPLNEQYLVKKGFNLKKRPISATLNVLHNFIELCTENKIHDYVDKEKDKEKEVDSKSKTSVTNQDFVKSLKTNPAYEHINIDIELAKMDAWLSTHKGRQKTRRFVVNWLNKIDRPIGKVNTRSNVHIPPKTRKSEKPFADPKIPTLIHKTLENMK
jgi:hypothetical protein